MNNKYTTQTLNIQILLPLFLNFFIRLCPAQQVKNILTKNLFI